METAGWRDQDEIRESAHEPHALQPRARKDATLFTRREVRPSEFRPAMIAQELRHVTLQFAFKRANDRRPARAGALAFA